MDEKNKNQQIQQLNIDVNRGIGSTNINLPSEKFLKQTKIGGATTPSLISDVQKQPTTPTQTQPMLQTESPIDKLANRIPADWGEFATLSNQVTDILMTKIGFPYSYRDKIQKRVAQRLLSKGYAPPKPISSLTIDNVVDNDVLFTKLKLANMIYSDSFDEMNEKERKIFESYKTSQMINALNILRLINQKIDSQSSLNPLLDINQQILIKE
jgi:hypothetical protein